MKTNIFHLCLLIFKWQEINEKKERHQSFVMQNFCGHVFNERKKETISKIFNI